MELGGTKLERSNPWHQIRYPFRVLHIGLATRNFLHVLSVGRDDLQCSFQNGVDRLPIDSGAFHGQVGAAS